MMAFAGLAAIMGGNGISATAEKLPGTVMALCGALGFALGTVLAKKLPLPLPPIPAAAWQIGLGCFPIVIIGFAIESTHIEKVTLLGWWLLVYSTVIQFYIAYVSWFAQCAGMGALQAGTGFALLARPASLPPAGRGRECPTRRLADKLQGSRL